MAEEAKQRGNTAFKAQDYKTAVKEYSAAIELDPDNAVFFSNRSACFAKLKEYKKALDDADACITLKRTWSKGYSRKGCALFELRRFKEAKEAYTQAVEYAEENEKSQLRKDVQRCDKQQKASSLLAGGPLDVLLLAVNFGVPLCALLTLISSPAFYWCMKLSMVSAIIGVYRVAGMPQFSKEYAAQVFATPQTHQFFMASIFLLAKASVLPTVPHSAVSGMWVLQWIQRRLPTLKPDLWMPISEQVRKANSHSNEVTMFIGQMEVVMGIFLIVELLTPSRNVIVIVMYWQILRMRYSIQQLNPYGPQNIVMAFSAIRMKMDSWIMEPSWMPSFLKTIYTKIISFISSMADVRAQQEQMNSLKSKCTIS